jgi:TetR/AcrR family transcriptional repressor of nem operon
MNPPADTEQRILDSARELIYARSYADVGVAAICEHAGVKKGSFYHFFPSKRDLTLAVLEAYFTEFKNNLLEGAFTPDVPPLARLRRLGDLLYGFQKQIADSTGHLPGCPFGNLAVELSTQEEPIRERVADIFGRTEARIRDTLTEAMARGDLPGLDIEATARAMLAYMEGVMLMAKTRNDPEVVRALMPALADIRIPAAGSVPNGAH